jgi:hypothetical protein
MRDAAAIGAIRASGKHCKEKFDPERLNALENIFHMPTSLRKRESLWRPVVESKVWLNLF